MSYSLILRHAFIRSSLCLHFSLLYLTQTLFFSLHLLDYHQFFHFWRPFIFSTFIIVSTILSLEMANMPGQQKKAYLCLCLCCDVPCLLFIFCLGPTRRTCRSHSCHAFTCHALGRAASCRVVEKKHEKYFCIFIIF